MKKPNQPAPPERLRSSSPEMDGEAKARAEELRAERLDRLGEELKKSRQDAIDGRAAAGIDARWREDIEFYEGIDDANRGEVSSNWATKPPGAALTPISDELAQKGEVRSNVFVNITRPYCDSASARIGDMLMPTNDRAFSIGPTPVPELADLAMGKLSEATKNALMQQASLAAMQPEERLKALAKMTDEKVKQAKAEMDEAKKRGERAQARIDDWLVECQYQAHVRKVIDDCARIGSGVLKGPVPGKKKTMKVGDKDGELAIIQNIEINPQSRWVNPLNFFPDPACGENIHNGSFTWERDTLTRKRLMELKGTPGYIDAQIDRCLEEGPKQYVAGGGTLEARNPSGQSSDDQFEIWYMHGAIKKEDLEAVGCQCEEGELVYAIITMVNDRVIKGARNHLDTGEFPYDVMNWQGQSGTWAGIGVSRQIRTPQRMVNAATRNMMDNAGLSAGPQILMKLGVVTPADGNPTLSPRKIWYISMDADLNDVKQAFGVFNIDSRQAELMSIIEFGLRLAEDVTGLPLLLQGQQGTAPDTLGGMQMLNNNSGTVLRRLAKNFDNSITEPHIRRYYVWLMQYGDESEKGDMEIEARGSSALVERDLQDQTIQQMGQIVLNPAFGVDPKRWFGEWCKSKRLDPKTFQYTDEEQAKIDEMAKQGPSDPRMAVAQLRAQMETTLQAKGQQFQQQITMLEQRFEAGEKEKDRMLAAWIAQLEQSGTKQISLDSLKGKLGDTAIKAKLQRDLSQQKAGASQVMKPPAEPSGRAPAGQAFTK